MNCPRCNVPLIVEERNEVDFDYCPGCQGAWLERGKLDLILQRALAEINVRDDDDIRERRKGAKRREHHPGKAKGRLFDMDD